jgi:hypothetical protein
MAASPIAALIVCCCASRHRPEVGNYQANVLRPSAEEVVIAAQVYDQQRSAIDYASETGS